jgi:uncharacterized membrane protein (DUF4010 family)
VLLVISRALVAALGDRGLYLGAAAAGLADVDAITLSIAAMNHGDIAGATAVAAVLLAAAVNTVVKSALALAIGGRRLGVRVAASLLAALAGAPCSGRSGACDAFGPASNQRSTDVR